MHLSISNFNNIYKTVIIFFFIFIIYNIYLIIKQPEITMYQNAWQSNISKSQDYIYNEKAQNIIVGSSMSATIKDSFLPSDYFNLSFSGGSSLTGLEIIKRSGKIPKRIFIESNILLIREMDYKLIDQIYTPFIWRVKTNLPALHEKYQPLNVISSFVYRNYGKTHTQMMENKINKKIFDDSMKIQLESMDKELKNYKKKISQLREFIDYFESLGTKLYFFKLPVEKLILNTNIYKEQNNVLKKNFDNIWIPYDMKKTYFTSDGMHLTYKSAYLYSQDFLNETHEIHE